MLKRDSKGRFLAKYRLGNCIINLPSIIDDMNDIDYIIEHIKKNLEKRSNTSICFVTIINFKLLKDCWKENQND